VVVQVAQVVAEEVVIVTLMQESLELLIQAVAEEVLEMNQVNPL
tara:strand:+ start:371 stop:502 length:132 start_codon:yes stop_codon:yes gene_type:complete